MIIAVIEDMTQIPDTCYGCPRSEYESGDCNILKQSGQQIRPFNCPLICLGSDMDILIRNEKIKGLKSNNS